MSASSLKRIGIQTLTFAAKQLGYLLRSPGAYWMNLSMLDQISAAGIGQTYYITKKGVQVVEQISLADSDLIQRNRRAREQILRILEQEFREKGIEFYLSIHEIAVKAGMPPELVHKSIWYSALREQVRHNSDAEGFIISPYGLQSLSRASNEI